ncbi:hypothetical protein Salat_2878700 [Sesamum alatum]|uniref:Uncharacterized protein n=1 Tax=Sesamum alatum TaxID=300844 RepID=A0AAE1XNJ0_9LAMI|nr:hypothetical protein Salat_2878700 [Sesamum alatum]
MSIIVSCLLLVLLCFSFNACNGRSLGLVVKDEKPAAAAAETQHSVTKKNEKVKSSRVSIQLGEMKSSIPDASKNAMRFEEIKVKSESNEPGKRIQAKGEGTAQNESSLATHVSWKVPHRKRGEQEPGFNLDYLPPKTHPPVHN